MKPYLFTIPKCPACYELKEKLNRGGVDYVEIDTTKNSGIWKEVNKQSGRECLIPTVFIPTGASGEGDVYSPEHNFQTIDEIVNIILSKLP